MVPTMRVPHMRIDSDDGKPIADQSGKYVRKLDDLSGLSDAFATSTVSNDDVFGEDDSGLSAFADLAAGDNLGKDIGLKVSDSVLKSSGVSLSGVESDFFSSDLSGVGRGARLRSNPLRFKSSLIVKSTLPPSHESLVMLCSVNGVGTSLCGGAIGKVGIQAYVAPIFVVSSHCGFQIHLSKTRTLLNGSLYIRTPSSTGKDYVHLSSILQSSSVGQEVVSALLQVAQVLRSIYS